MESQFLILVETNTFFLMIFNLQTYCSLKVKVKVDSAQMRIVFSL